ncbi:DUF4351 domain-containing protein, partial [Gloeocapsa sp. PCC 73106]|uniref:DUF4351 domain-containing protein n=1 Tax=Gloeocapsa sp. PCC 73106 TaxID=102232 RepID=UPI0002AC25A2
EKVMEIVTSWMEKGIEQGIEQGKKSLVIRQLKRRLGEIPVHLETEIRSLPLEAVERLGEALLDFQSLEDLVSWLS